MLRISPPSTPSVKFASRWIIPKTEYETIKDEYGSMYDQYIEKGTTSLTNYVLNFPNGWIFQNPLEREFLYLSRNRNLNVYHADTLTRYNSKS